MGDKLVSFALPAYNAGKYIGECLDCLLAQTYENFEIVLIDDCSTDDTAQVVAGYADSRIRYYKNDENLGIVHTLNRAYGLCRGDYIARMDADDTCTPDRLEKQVALLETMPEVGLVATGLEMFGDRTGIIRYSADPDIIQCRLLHSLQLAHNAWLFRRELLDIHHLAYRDEYRYAEDWDFLVRASRVTKFSNATEPLTGYRMFPQQSSSVHSAAQKAAADKVARDQLEYLGLQLPEEEFRVYRMAYGKREKLLTTGEMETLIAVVKKIEAANESAGFYDRSALHAVIAEEIGWLCYYNLIHRRKSGLKFFRSGYAAKAPLGASIRAKAWVRAAITAVAGKE